MSIFKSKIFVTGQNNVQTLKTCNDLKTYIVKICHLSSHKSPWKRIYETFSLCHVITTNFNELHWDVMSTYSIRLYSDEEGKGYKRFSKSFTDKSDICIQSLESILSKCIFCCNYTCFVSVISLPALHINSFLPFFLCKYLEFRHIWWTHWLFLSSF